MIAMYQQSQVALLVLANPKLVMSDIYLEITKPRTRCCTSALYTVESVINRCAVSILLAVYFHIALFLKHSGLLESTILDSTASSTFLF